MTKYIIRRNTDSHTDAAGYLGHDVHVHQPCARRPGGRYDRPGVLRWGAGDKLRARMGLDKPIHERYLLWLIEVSPFSSSCVDRDPTCETLRLDHIPGTSSWPIPTDIVPTSLNLKIWPPDVNLGYSYQFGVSVMSMIGNRIIPTLELTIVALLAATVIGTALGVIHPNPPPKT